VRALISVSDKTGIVEFAKNLAALDFEIISTGGTYKLLKEEGVKALEISEVTKFPEMFDGRVKTLNPMIHGGILHRRDLPFTCKGSQRTRHRGNRLGMRQSLSV